MKHPICIFTMMTLMSILCAPAYGAEYTCHFLSQNSNTGTMTYSYSNFPNRRTLGIPPRFLTWQPPGIPQKIDLTISYDEHTGAKTPLPLGFYFRMRNLDFAELDIDSMKIEFDHLPARLFSRKELSILSGPEVSDYLPNDSASRQYFLRQMELSDILTVSFISHGKEAFRSQFSLKGRRDLNRFVLKSRRLIDRVDKRYCTHDLPLWQGGRIVGGG